MQLPNIKHFVPTVATLAAIALTASTAGAQNRSSQAVIGRSAPTNNNHVVHHGNAYAHGGFYGNNYAQHFYSYAPYIYSSTPYVYSPVGSIYSQGGALVLGSNGQLSTLYAVGSSVDPMTGQNGVTNPAPIRTSNRIEAVRLPGNRLQIQWNGDTTPVASLKFSLLDHKRVTLQTTVVTDLPAAATFSLPSNAAYYRVVITYSDGAVRSIVAAL